MYIKGYHGVKYSELKSPGYGTEFFQLDVGDSILVTESFCRRLFEMITVRLKRYEEDVGDKNVQICHEQTSQTSHQHILPPVS